ncbi:hypothetical protein GCM10010431_07660 [Streptomyces kunmingensis]
MLGRGAADAQRRAHAFTDARRRGARVHGCPEADAPFHGYRHPEADAPFHGYRHPEADAPVTSSLI